MAFWHPLNKQLTKKELLAIATVIVKNCNSLCSPGTTFSLTNAEDPSGKTKDIYTAQQSLIVIKKQLYAIEKTLGEGAFGSVHKARNLFTDEKVAIKRQKFQCCPDPMVQMQVKVTCCHGIGLCKPEVNTEPEYLSDGNVYFVLPLADSVYYKWVQKTFMYHPNNGWRKVISALINVVDDLERLHKDNKVHMDLKGDNILIIDDHAYLSDFGKTEPIGKFLPLIPCWHHEYPHNAPEYFIDRKVYPGMTSSFYFTHESFDAWSLGTMISRDIHMFPLEIQEDLKTIVRGLQQISPEKRAPMKAVRDYLVKISKK